MESRLSVIGLQVADLARSLAFYEALGWKPAGPPMDEVAFIQLNGIVLSLYVHQARDAGIEEANGDAPSARIALAYNTRSRDEVDAVLARMEAAGARITRPAYDSDWGGRTSYVADPDGHLWEIAWNPGFPIDARGDVTAQFD